MVNLSNSPETAQIIIASGAVPLLLAQFGKIRDARFAKIFGNLAMNAEFIDIELQRQLAGTFVQIAAESADDLDLVNECLIVIAGCEGGAFGPQSAQMLLKLAFGVLNSPEMRLDLSIEAIGTIAALLSQSEHYTQMQNCEEFNYLGELLVRQLAESVDYINSCEEKGIFELLFNGEDGDIESYELLFENMEYDLVLNVLLCVLRAVQYDSLRRQMLAMPQFMIIIKKMLSFELERPENDEICPRYMQQLQTEKQKPQKEGTNAAELLKELQDKILKEQHGQLIPLLWKSRFTSVKERTWDMMMGICDYICDCVIQKEEGVAEEWKEMRFWSQNQQLEEIIAYIK